MERFRINQNDMLKINITHNGKLILPTIVESFNSIQEIKAYCLKALPWDIKTHGRRIEIGIHNITKEQSKYINTFS